jgi:hypothetical protein
MKMWNVLVGLGLKFTCNLEPRSAQAAAKKMGVADEIRRDLARPGGPKIAAAIGRDGKWLRAFVASDRPEATGIDWLEMAVSPVTEESISWLISLVSMLINMERQSVREA